MSIRVVVLEVFLRNISLFLIGFYLMLRMVKKQFGNYVK